MGVILNIVVYVLLSVIMIMRLVKEPKSNKIALFNFVFCMWAVFFTAYLITEYKEIVSQPLNEELNWYETVTNFLIGIYFLMDYCGKSTLKNES